ncbi:MAG: DMT family transporter [Microcystaceae cyanobacterium]
MLNFLNGRYILIIAALILSTASPVTRRLVELGSNHLVDGRNPISFCNVLFIGNVVALIAFLVIYGRKSLLRQLQQLTRVEWIGLIAIAVLAGALVPSLYFTALEKTGVNNVILVSQVKSPLTLALSVYFLKEKINKWIVVGAVTSLMGVILTVILQDPSNQAAMAGVQPDLGLGSILVLIATTIQAFNTIVDQGRLKHIPLGLVNIIKTSFSTVAFFIIAVQLFGLEHFQDAFSPFLWQWMLFYSLVLVVFGQLLWLQGVRNSSGSEVSLVNALTPVASIIAAFLILGEVPSQAQYIGGVVILLGIIITQIGIRRKTKPMAKELTPNTGFKGI